MSSCPNHEQLLGFLRSSFADPEAKAISNHLESCGICQAKLEMMTTEPSLVLRADVTGAYSPPTSTWHDEPGTVLAGRYKLVERIGEGGMGTIWSAQQNEPVRRKVAIKLIKRGLESEQVLTRFESERQALAVMDHPNIAKVLDGGLHGARPFFVMELVKGVPITQFCDAHRLTPRQRLELLLPVCHAIQHAHQKGIIHRDIKPSNVLIAMFDERPVPKVIDFGVAKAITGTLTEATLETGFGAIVGTPQYMSPEQATFNNLDIDTRTDVYSLGVLLYELLSGSPPFSSQELENKGLLEMLRVVREDDPPRPSTKLSTADALPSLSANRGTEPKKLTGILRNELDWIVMKALEKDRGRRYETASAFASDISRYLAGEPIHAHPPSASYRFRKLLRRHRAVAIAVCSVLAALLLGLIGTTYQMYRATRFAEAEHVAKLDAQAKKVEADEQRQLASDRLAQVEAEKRVADAFQDFLQNDLLLQADARVQADALRLLGANLATTANPSIRELLDRAAVALTTDKLEAKFPGQPLVQAKVLFTVGSAYSAVAEHPKAIEHLRRATNIFRREFGAADPRTASSLQIEAFSLKELGDYPRAIDVLNELIGVLREHYPDDHPDVLKPRSDLAHCLWLAGHSHEAVPMLESIVANMARQTDPDNRIQLEARERLGLMYQRARHDAKALATLMAVRDARARTQGPEHPSTLVSEQNVALTLLESGKPNDAVPIFERVRDRASTRFGPDHPVTLNIIGNLAKAHLSANRVAIALPMLEQTYAGRRKVLGEDNPTTLMNGHDLASAYRLAGRVDEAIQLYRETIEAQSAKLGADHDNTVASRIGLGRAFEAGKNWPDAIAIYESLRDGPARAMKADHPQLATILNRLAVSYQSAGRTADGVGLLESGRQRFIAELGSGHHQTLAITRSLASLHHAGKDWPREELLLRDLVDGYTKSLGPTDLMTMSNVLDLGTCLIRQQKWAESESVLRDSLRIRQQTFPDGVATMQVKSLLGEALSQQKKFAEAEPLLLAGHEGLKRQEGKIPAQVRQQWLSDARARLVQHCEAAGKPELAKQWR